MCVIEKGAEVGEPAAPAGPPGCHAGHAGRAVHVAVQQLCRPSQHAPDVLLEHTRTSPLHERSAQPRPLASPPRHYLPPPCRAGAHILSGNVLQPTALDELLPGWREDPDCPIHRQPATASRFYYLTRRAALRLPNPPQMGHKGNYVISLRWGGAAGGGCGGVGAGVREGTRRSVTAAAACPACGAAGARQM